MMKPIRKNKITGFFPSEIKLTFKQLEVFLKNKKPLEKIKAEQNLIDFYKLKIQQNGVNLS